MSVTDHSMGLSLAGHLWKQAFYLNRVPLSADIQIMIAAQHANPYISVIESDTESVVSSNNQFPDLVILSQVSNVFVQIPVCNVSGFESVLLEIVDVMRDRKPAHITTSFTL